jgi:guanylate kinase
VKEKALQCKLLFIAPPSLETLTDRLTGRGTETAEKIAIRMHNAKEELEYGYGEGNFDAVIVNDDLETSYAELKKQLREWYPEITIGGNTPPPSSRKEGEGSFK